MEGDVLAVHDEVAAEVEARLPVGSRQRPKADKVIFHGVAPIFTVAAPAGGMSFPPESPAPSFRTEQAAPQGLVLTI